MADERSQGMRGRPAESTAGAGAVAYLIAYVLGVRSPETLAALGAVLGLVPAIVTLFLDAGGVRGVLRKIWSGRAASA